MALATADIHIKVEPEIKTSSEKVLKEIGISMSDLINMTLRKLIRDKTVPFDITAEAAPENLRINTKEQLIRFLEVRDAAEPTPEYSSEQMREILSARLGVSI